jgi:hypothetical protein
MTNFNNQGISPINPKDGGNVRPTGFTQVEQINGVKAWQIPEYARFKMLVNHVDGKNKKGYSIYYSIDYDDKTGVYDEAAGYGKLEKMMKNLPPRDYRLATIFANFTNDLSTKSKNYNWQVAIIRDGKYTMYRKVEYFILKKYSEIGTKKLRHDIKVDISETLKNFA